MLGYQVLQRFALLSLLALGACQSATVADAGYENGAKPSPLKEAIAAYDDSAAVPQSLKTKILEQALAQQSDLGFCQDSFNQEQSKNYSQVYGTPGSDQYLVQVLCFQAAYQGNYEFLRAEVSQNQLSIKPLKLSLAGFPSFDPQTQVLSNGYKFRGIGDCIEATEHRWTGFDLVLLSSQLEEAQPGSCEMFQGGESYEIEADRVGVARLGMTVAELKAQMGQEASYEAVPMGVDLGTGLEVSQYGQVQFVVGNGSEEPMTDQSVIRMISVKHPAYKTAEGVGPGTLIKTAIAHYGKATLSINSENESRESIEFERGVPKNIWLRSNQWALDGEAGLYADTQSSYKTTTTFKDKAAIGLIMVLDPEL